MKNLDLRIKTLIPSAVSMLSTVPVKYAVNSEIYDENDKRYIDFASGTSTMNVGHSHPRIVNAIKQQVEHFTHTFFQLFPYSSYLDVVEHLNNVVPGDFNKKTVLLTDGATAVENAIKLAKAYTGRSGVISFHGAYHGRTLLTLSMAGRVNPYKTKLGTPVNDIYQVPFPFDAANVTLDDVKNYFSSMFKHTVNPESIAAIIIEPVQGEGGFRIASTNFMRFLREVCDQYGIVMIADEVQTGFGRTGKYFAMEHFDTAADLTVMSKSIAAGIPMSAVTGKDIIMDALPPGGLGGTFSGNPLGCAAALTVFDIIENEKLLERASSLGDTTLTFLKTLKSKHKQIIDVRGLGSMLAIELIDQSTAKKIQAAAREMGLFLITGGIDGNVIRILYPLTIQDNILDEGLSILEKAFDKL